MIPSFALLDVRGERRGRGFKSIELEKTGSGSGRWRSKGQLSDATTVERELFMWWEECRKVNIYIE